MKLYAAGVGPIQLGVSIVDIAPVRGFNEEDRKKFIPGPGPDAWFKYEGPLDRIVLSSGGSFKADALYMAVNEQRRINCIQLFPADDDTPLVEMLTEEFGPGSALGEVPVGMKYYLHYMFYSPDKKITITYSGIYDTNFDLNEMAFRYTFDMDALMNYKLMYHPRKFH